MRMRNNMNFKESYDFLEEHPAFNCKLYKCLTVMVVNVCKNGYALDGVSDKSITLYPNDPEFSKWWDRAEDVDRFYTYDENNKIEPRSVEVKYEDYFGYPYKVSHVEVWLEIGAIYNDEEDERVCYDHSLDTGAGTFEEAIIILAQKVKEKYGDYTMENILPKWIRDINQYDDKNYIFVPDRVVNEYWWQTHMLKLDPKARHMHDSAVDISMLTESK
jgi:hypothetical protein